MTQKEVNRSIHLERTYGITLLEYEKLWYMQHERCAICKTQRLGKHGTAAVDHDHETGEIRGLLCRRCNTGLGQFKDNTTYLNNAINYLDNHAEKVFNTLLNPNDPIWEGETRSVTIQPKLDWTGYKEDRSRI